MISAVHLDSVHEGVAQLAYALLAADPDTDGEFERIQRESLLAQLEADCAAQRLNGLVYVFHLFRKMLAQHSSVPLVADDHAVLVEWLGLVGAYTEGRVDAADSRGVVEQLMRLSWFPPLSPKLLEQMSARLAQDTVLLYRAPEPQPEPEPEPVACFEAAVVDDAAAAAPSDEHLAFEIGATVLADAAVAAAANESAGVPVALSLAWPPEDAADDVEPPVADAAFLPVTDPADGAPVSWVSDEELGLVIEAICAQLMPLAMEIDAQTEHAPQLAALAAYREQFDLIAAAADALGLPALSIVCQMYTSALDHLAASPTLLAPDQTRLLGEWPMLLVAHLQAPNDAPAATDLAVALSTFPAPGMPSMEAALAFAAELNRVAIGLDPALRAARKTRVEPGDVDLDIAPDVLPTVLAGMLQELPGRASEFSARIQKFVRSGAPDDLDTARRIAHTLKGDGNIVGVRGIANLTHALEEILLKLAEAPAVPEAELADVLVDAADCLESMSDYVLKRGAAPGNSGEVLQQVLNWANALQDGETPGLPAPAPAAADDAPAAATTAEPAAEPEQQITVSVRVLDQLLRLTGEAVIYARQVENRVERIDGRAGDVSQQNNALQALVTELQQLVEVRGAAAGSLRMGLGEELDALEMDRYNELHTVTVRLVEASADARATMTDIAHDVTTLRDLLSQQDRIHLDLQNQVLRTRTLPVTGLLPRLQRVVRQTARQLGKECDFAVAGEDTAVDHEILDRLAEPLVHMLRNAVDHGLETIEERRDQGKPDSGRIELGFRREADLVHIRCRDDGRGLDHDAIRATAVARGLIAADAELAPDELTQLIFRPGFSTRSQTTQTSGRGIGMDIVHRSIAQLKGSLMVRSTRGQGCEFVIQLPVSQVVAQVLLVRASAATVAVALRGVEKIVAIDVAAHLEGELADADGRELPLYSLDHLLGYPPARELRTRAALQVHLGDERRCLVRVGELGEARSVIVKNLGACVPPLPGVLGATILGDGTVAPVTDLVEILGAHSRQAQAAYAATEDTAPVALPQVLIVDDSLSVRRSLEQLVADAGFLAATARDGIEAVERVRERLPDMILVDLEMPRMNGLELTSFIRKNEATRAIPVVMITSRTTERHHELARAAGVDAILAKPYSEERLLQLIEECTARTRD